MRPVEDSVKTGVAVYCINIRTCKQKQNKMITHCSEAFKWKTTCRFHFSHHRIQSSVCTYQEIKHLLTTAESHVQFSNIIDSDARWEASEGSYPYHCTCECWSASCTDEFVQETNIQNKISPSVGSHEQLQVARHLYRYSKHISKMQFYPLIFVLNS